MAKGKAKKKKTSPAASNGEMEKLKDRMNRANIISFYLRLFVLQEGAKETDRTEIVPVPDECSGSKFVYELRVEKDEEWRSHRITVGRLGEDSGSKSMCYYVIFGVYQVIKIPPDRLTDFNEYVKSVKKESHIVTRLAPMECIVPKISFIMTMAHALENTRKLNADALEDRYIEWLRKNKKFQKYLMIGDRFCYFMELADNLFLSHVLEDVHDKSGKMLEEATRYPDVIWEPYGFEDRYGHGEENEKLCAAIQNLYDKCETKIKKLLEGSSFSRTVRPYQMKNWFLVYLGDGKIDENEKGLNSKAITGLNRLLTNIMKSNEKTVNGYRRLLREYINKRTFGTIKLQVEGLTTNLLDLLAWLRKKGVAMRDLKPDNILVAGELSDYPLFLRSSEEYKLGLIDVETAVVFKKGKDGKIEKPQLGGTPFFATPSHLFSNELIETFFDDVSEILHLQDWYAVVVMTYMMITGEYLFIKTAQKLALVQRNLQVGLKKKKDLPEVMKDINRTFWLTAIKEFQIRMNAHEKILKTVKITIPLSAEEMFPAEFLKDKIRMLEQVKEFVISQKVFEGDKIQKQFIEAPSEKIRRQINKWEKGYKKATPKKKQEIVKALRELESMKIKMERLKAKMSAYTLMEHMFTVVVEAMFNKEWR